MMRLCDLCKMQWANEVKSTVVDIVMYWCD